MRQLGQDRRPALPAQGAQCGVVCLKARAGETISVLLYTVCRIDPDLPPEACRITCCTLRLDIECPRTSCWLATPSLCCWSMLTFLSASERHGSLPLR